MPNDLKEQRAVFGCLIELEIEDDMTLEDYRNRFVKYSIVRFSDGKMSYGNHVDQNNPTQREGSFCFLCLYGVALDSRRMANILPRDAIRPRRFRIPKHASGHDKSHSK